MFIKSDPLCLTDCQKITLNSYMSKNKLRKLLIAVL